MGALCCQDSNEDVGMANNAKLSTRGDGGINMITEEDLIAISLG